MNLVDSGKQIILLDLLLVTALLSAAFLAFSPSEPPAIVDQTPLVEDEGPCRPNGSGTGAMGGKGDFAACNWDSALTDDGMGLEERWIIVATSKPIGSAHLNFSLDGEPIAVTWEDSDGTISKGDRFSFVAEPQDFPQRLEASDPTGNVVWSVDKYRGGNGDGVGLS